MVPQRQKTSKCRGQKEDSENHMPIPKASKANANKVCFQKNRRALGDLTNQAVTTPMKSLGNASDEEDEPGSYFQQSIKNPSGPQTRSKTKSILLLIPIDDCQKQTNSNAMGVQGLHFEPKTVEAAQPFRLTRNMAKTLKMSTLNNLDKPKEVSHQSSPKGAKAGSLETLLFPTESQVKSSQISPDDDVYGFEYDSSECKPAKKKRTRKPKTEDDVYKARKVILAPKPTKRLPRTVIGYNTDDAEKSSIRTQIGTKPFKAVKTTKDTTPLLNAVAEKLEKLTDHIIDESDEVDLDDVSHIYPVVDQSVNVCDVTFPKKANAEILSDLKDKPNESGVLAGDLEETGQVIPSNISQAEATLENLFGFKDLKNESLVCATDKTVKKQLAKSTLIEQRTIAECFASMSPVRKVTKASRKSVNRPARIDDHVARDLIRGIRPLHPAMDKEKSTSLMQYLKDVPEEQDPDENSDSMINVPPTPPSVFTQTPRRSHSKREFLAVKRTLFLDDDDKELEPRDEEEAAPKKLKKRVAGRTVRKRHTGKGDEFSL